MAEDVTIYVYRDGPEPVDGVFVGIYNNTTKALLQADTTGDGALPDGTIIFPNVDPGTYEVRLAPVGSMMVAGGRVQTIEVIDTPVAPESNIFDIKVSQEGLPLATNANLCRCSGFFVDLTGRVYPYLSIHFSDANIPQLEYIEAQDYSARAIAPSRRVVQTDSAGYVSVDLYRGATYEVYLEGWQNAFKSVLIPDAPSCNIADVLFPYAAYVEWYDGDTKLLPLETPSITMSVGEEKTLSYKVILRNGNEAAADEVNICVEPLDGQPTTSFSSGSFTLVPEESGVFTYTPVRIGTTYATISPVPDLVGTLEVTVT